MRPIGSSKQKLKVPILCSPENTDQYGSFLKVANLDVGISKVICLSALNYEPKKTGSLVSKAV